MNWIRSFVWVVCVASALTIGLVHSQHISDAQDSKESEETTKNSLKPFEAEFWRITEFRELESVARQRGRRKKSLSRSTLVLSMRFKLPEGYTHPAKFGYMMIEKAEDNLQQKLSLTDRYTLTDKYGEFERWGYDSGRGRKEGFFVVDVPLVGASRDTSTISIKGSAKFVLLSDPKKLEITSLNEYVGKSLLKAEGLSIVLASVDPDAAIFHIKGDKTNLVELRILDSFGETVCDMSSMYSEYLDSLEGEFETFVYKLKPEDEKIAKDHKLVLTYATKKEERRLPFEFKDLKLP